MRGLDLTSPQFSSIVELPFDNAIARPRLAGAHGPPLSYKASCRQWPMRRGAAHAVAKAGDGLRPEPSMREALIRNYRVGGGVLGQGEVGCAGDAVIGAAAGAGEAAGAGLAACFLAAGFLAAGGFAAFGVGPAGVSSTTTGLGRNLGGSPVAWITSSLSDSGW